MVEAGFRKRPSPLDRARAAYLALDAKGRAAFREWLAEQEEE
jgi:hypothetical protein